MPVFRSIVFSAALAGLIVGVVISIAQFFGTVPLIQQSEVYERKAVAGTPTGHDHASAANDQNKAHSHESEWEPEAGLQRNAFTVAANILTAIGFALLLTGVYAIRGRQVMWREGLLWGLAGFVVFTAAPGLGLPPELPGMPVAELTARQTWWIATAAATAGGPLCELPSPGRWAPASGSANRFWSGTSQSLSTSTSICANLAACPNLAGVKYAVPDVIAFADIVADTGYGGAERLVWVCGLAESWAPFFWVAGAEGFTSGLASVAPELSLRLFDELDAGNPGSAMRVWRRL